MAEHSLKALNYCADAIEDLAKSRKSILHQATYSEKSILKVIKMLNDSDKYLLPNCCALNNPENLSQTHLDLARLPAPCVAFESSWDRENDGIDELAGFEQMQSSKRIALCWELRPEYEILPWQYKLFKDMFPGGGTFILPIFYLDESRQWTIPMGGSFVPHGNTMRTVKETDDTPDTTIIAASALIEKGMSSPTAQHFICEPFVIMPERFIEMVKQIGDRERVIASIILDSKDEVYMFVQACSALHCENITTTELPCPEALNKKRLSKGKQPFFNYKTIFLADTDGEHEIPYGDVIIEGGKAKWFANTPS